jgi:hypothetical protein
MASDGRVPTDSLATAFRSLQWTLRDLNGTVDQLAQSYDGVKRSQNLFGWGGAIVGTLILTAFVWMANDLVQLRHQLDRTQARFDVLDAQITALGTRIESVDQTLRTVGADISTARANGGLPAPPGGYVEAALTPDAGAAAIDSRREEILVAINGGDPALGGAVVAANGSWWVAPSPAAPRDQLTPAELAAYRPPAAEPAPAAAAPAAAAPAAEPQAEVAAVEPAEVPVAAEQPAAAPQKAAAAASGGKLSDSDLLAYDDDQISAEDELLTLDENGNPQ